MHANGPRLNNYAVTLLVLFYLQHNGFSPTLYDMRLAVKKEDKVFINGFNCSFCTNIYPSKKATSCGLSELLSGFFNFYSKVNFSEKVIDLSTAALTNISDITSSPEMFQNCAANAPSASQLAVTFRTGFLNIRDPFELDHNVTGNVNEKHLKIFTKRLRIAALACKMLRFTAKGKANEQWGILNLFIDHHHKEKSPQATKTECGSYKLHFKRPEQSCDKWSAQLVASLIITILRDVFHISFSSPSSHSSNIESTNNSCSSPIDESRDNHVNGRPIDCVSSDEITRKRKASSPDACGTCKRAKLIFSSPTASRISSTLDASSFVELPFTCVCVATHKLWEGRRKARRHLAQEGKANLLELERQVSKLLLSDRIAVTDDSLNLSDSFNTSHSSVNSVSQPIIKFSLTLSEEQHDLLTAMFLPEIKSTAFSTFFHHLEIFLPGFILKCINC